MFNQFVDSGIFFFTIFSLLFASIYVVRAAVKIHNYEKQVDRGWDDLIRRADEMVSRLNIAISSIQRLEHNEKKKSVKKITQKKVNSYDRKTTRKIRF